MPSECIVCRALSKVTTDTAEKKNSEEKANGLAHRRNTTNVFSSSVRLCVYLFSVWCEVDSIFFLVRCQQKWLVGR